MLILNVYFDFFKIFSGFYRKDHLRKHTRSHIARRVKAELSQQGGSGAGSTLLSLAVPAPAAPPP